jgi:hypothetical protein
LVNTNQQALGASSVQTLVNEIPPTQVARWVIPITAPAQIGLYRTDWRMAHEGEPFGATVSCVVMVVPQGKTTIDLGTLLEEWISELLHQMEVWLDDLAQQITDRINEFLEDLMQYAFTSPASRLPPLPGAHNGSQNESSDRGSSPDRRHSQYRGF